MSTARCSAVSAARRACILFLMIATRRKGGGPVEALSSGMFEVVGKGRIASLFLRQDGSLSVDRDAATIGVQSPDGAPIIVATPSQAWEELYQKCHESRRADVVWMGNGLPEQTLGGENCTWVVPHFGILEINGPIISSPNSPPTYVRGKHAQLLRRLLENEGLVNVQVLDTVASLRVHAVRKLLWASCLWLLCHSKDPALTVSQVHSKEATLLRQLVEDLWPVAQSLAGETQKTISDVLHYMEQYSLSMPQAIPSRDLALAELADRNGVFYRPGGVQPCHERLLCMQLLEDDGDEESCQTKILQNIRNGRK
eukprot:scaffold4494_cov161-Amphora_coffeaeformis.AAC.11